MSDSEILSISNPMMDNLMEASTEIDHGRHVRDFTDRMKNIVTNEYLHKVCEQYQSEKGDFAAEMVLVECENRYFVDHVLVF